VEKKIPKAAIELNVSSLCINSVPVYKKPLDQFPNLNYPPPHPPTPCAVNTQRNSENFVTAPPLLERHVDEKQKFKDTNPVSWSPSFGYIGGLSTGRALKS
jgi:hypothetical protein